MANPSSSPTAAADAARRQAHREFGEKAAPKLAATAKAHQLKVSVPDPGPDPRDPIRPSQPAKPVKPSDGG